jgi:hypothetical protein
MHYRREAEDIAMSVTQRGESFSRWKPSDADFLDFLEFDDTDERFYHALSVPESTDGMGIMGPNGKPVDKCYLLQRWMNGRDPGLFKDLLQVEHERIWGMPIETRKSHIARWRETVIADKLDPICTRLKEFSTAHTKWMNAEGAKNATVMRSKRIIGCTTTAAAMYMDQIEVAKPGVVLVEEAGEVLECHILTALSRNTKQLIMIGDHLQLRPKIKNYTLTVEHGEGFDLNCSLFERLVSERREHSVLAKQHRMRPEISALVKRLMYPGLEDSDGTLQRPDIYGVQSNVIFINHNHPEVSDARIKDRQEGNSNASRQNEHEAEMILKIVKYLAQQGYGSDKQVVLTPYLGQLKLIMDKLKTDHDPVLGDLDSHDLVKAGLLTAASASHSKKQLKISTIGM